MTGKEAESRHSASEGILWSELAKLPGGIGFDAMRMSLEVAANRPDMADGPNMAVNGATKESRLERIARETSRILPACAHWHCPISHCLRP